MSEDGHDSDESADVDGDIETDPFEDLEAADEMPVEDAFTEVDVEEIDEEDVWTEITSDETEAEPETAGEAELGVEEPATSEDEAEEVVVEKESYCQQCEYFSEPPEASCTHPGTDIIELVDSARFRVRNCPVVQRRRGTTEEVLKD